MQTLIIDPLRWQEKPSRVIVAFNGERPRTWLQVVTPSEACDICRGRPVEELPRILPILSPAHHLASAMALDRLFQVEPPLLAVNMREALLLAQYFSHHLRKMFFLLSQGENLFLDYHHVKRGGEHVSSTRRILDEIMQHVGLSQEASAILGGRPDHPVTAIAGGVSSYLKVGHYVRLTEIAEACLRFALALAEFAKEKVFGTGHFRNAGESTSMRPMAWLCLKGDTVNLNFPGDSGNSTISFSPEQILERVGFGEEAWTHEPFAYLKQQGWQGCQWEHSDSFYFVGPLARLNDGQPMETAEAERERQELIADLGPFPHFSGAAAYRAILVELIQSAEKMKVLYTDETLSGPSTRTIPRSIAREGWAALESPSGFVFHHYRVDGHGIVEDISVLDTATENNAIRCLTADSVVAASQNRGLTLQDLKERIEISLMPF